MEGAQTAGFRICGVKDRGKEKALYRNTVGKPGRRGSKPRSLNEADLICIRSSAGHEESCMKSGGPPSKAKYDLVTDSEQYREGKVKRTPGGD